MSEKTIRLDIVSAEEELFSADVQMVFAPAMMGEVGELAEIFQWKGDEKCNEGLKDWTDEKLIHLGEELSDILLYLVRLSDKCGIDLVAAAKRKLAINGLKYPAAAVRGKSGKYTEYKTQWRVEQASKKARKEKEEEKNRKRQRKRGEKVVEIVRKRKKRRENET